jgi:hypothetical protein
MKRWQPLACGSLLGLVLPAAALINPNYTPADLARDATAVLRVEFGPQGTRVLETLAGTAPAKFALPASQVTTGLVFLGTLDAAATSDAAPGDAPRPVGALHSGMAWQALVVDADGRWRMEEDKLNLKAVWAGGDEMLVRAIRYALATPRAQFPTVVGTTWQREAVVTKCTAPITVCVAREWRADAPPALVVGTQWFRWDGAAATWQAFSNAPALPAPAVADFDGDGQFEEFVAGKEALRLVAAGADRLAETGEIVYLAKPGGQPVVGDINSDGRDDVVLLYPDMGFQVFFNRGFRCFGHAIPLDLKGCQLVAARALREGQQTGTVADFDGDGAPDLAAVARDGTVYVLFAASPATPPLGLTLVLPANAPSALPVTVVAGEQSLGAKRVAPGQPCFVGLREKGPVTLRWQWPGQPARAEKITVLKPQRFEVPAP